MVSRVRRFVGSSGVWKWSIKRSSDRCPCLTTAYVTTSGSMPSDASLLKDEPQTRTDQVKLEALPPKLELSTLDVKEEVGEPDANEQIPDAVKEEVQDDREIQPHDSEDSLSQERIANELRQLTERQAHAPHQSSEEGATAPISEGATPPPSVWNRQEPTAPDTTWDWESGPYAPQRSGRYRGRLQSPDPYLFNTTIWIRHDSEASMRVHEDPMDQLRDRVYAMEHNLETLRTRLTQVADLQGI